MGSKSTLRALQAQERRVQREAQKHLRELERRAKEEAKLSVIEQARLEVEMYNSRLDVLLSLHKEQGEVRDWHATAAALAPVRPAKMSHHALRAKQLQCVSFLHPRTQGDTLVEEGCMRDEQELAEQLKSYEDDHSQWEKDVDLARRVLYGEHKAYIEALTEFNPLAEIAGLGSSVHFTVHNSNLLECKMKVNGSQAIPSEVRSLTASGKVSVKPMPKSRFHEIYQDYVCGSMLRVAREAFALLPVETVLITALADCFDAGTGRTEEQPVLSVAFPRVEFDALDFERLDPSDAVERFLYRGNFKASRKVGAFQPITALTPADLARSPRQLSEYRDLLTAARQLRDQIRAEIADLPSPKKPRPILDRML